MLVQKPQDWPPAVPDAVGAGSGKWRHPAKRQGESTDFLETLTRPSPDRSETVLTIHVPRSIRPQSAYAFGGRDIVHNRKTEAWSWAGTAISPQ